MTHLRVYAPPSSVTAAVDQIDAWLESPSAELIAEDVGYRDFSHLPDVVTRNPLQGE